MNKGYVPRRTPAAHQVAASLSKSFSGYSLYVEGLSDCSFWNNFVHPDNVKVKACNGWKEVVETVQRNIAAGNKCLGVVDSDFHYIIPEPEKVRPQIFITDVHDMEMMVYCSGDYVKAINAFDPRGRVSIYENDNNWSLMNAAKEIADKIARLKLTVKRNGLIMSFKYKKDDTIEYPDYEKMLDRQCQYVSDDKMIHYLSCFTRDKAKKSPSSENEILSLLQNENAVQYNEDQLLNGHDLTLLIFLLLKKKIKLSIPSNKSASDLETLLCTSYERAHLENTNLYKVLKQFGDNEGVQLFR